MDLEDLIKGKYRRHGHHHHEDHYHGHEHGYGDHHYHGGHHHGHYKLEMIRSIYKSLPHKKALLAVALIVIVLIIVIGISIMVALLPLAAKLLGYAGTLEVQDLLKTLQSLVPLFNG